MKLIDDLITKYEIDKILHFVVGGWITSLFGTFGLISLIIGVIFTLLISFIKEKWLDNEFDKQDIIAAMIGSLISVIVFSISFII